jgi:hypothetical protein
MDWALHELAGQYALNTAASKSRYECKSVRQVAKEWGGVPYVTLARYFAQPGYFQIGSRAGALHVLSRDDEKTIVDTIMQHAKEGMCQNHAHVRQKVGIYSYTTYMAMHTLVCSANGYLCTHVKWLIMEVIKRVPEKADYHVAQTWLKNNQPITYSWYRSFLN